jgi:hypothetical protein
LLRVSMDAAQAGSFPADVPVDAKGLRMAIFA